MDKKGISYVDWAISFGLFLITVIFIFILIKPNLERGYDQEGMLNIAQTQFMTSMEWTAKKLPIIIDKFQPYYTTNQGVEETMVQVKHASSYALDYSLPSDFELVDSNPFTFKCISANGCDKTSFTIIAYPLSNVHEQPPELTVECIPQNQAICDAVLGATETLRGLSQKDIDNFKVLTYEQQRSTLTIPQTIHVAFFLDNTQLTHNTELPGPQTNVYVREMRTWILDEDGTMTPTVVRIQAWR